MFRKNIYITSSFRVYSWILTQIQWVPKNFHNREKLGISKIRPIRNVRLIGTKNYTVGVQYNMAHFKQLFISCGGSM